MKFASAALRVSAEIGGVFLILSVTADAFDAMEMVALICIAALLVTVEIAVAFARDSTGSRRGSARVTVLAVLAVLGLAFVHAQLPRYTPSHVAQANIAVLIQLYG